MYYGIEGLRSISPSPLIRLDRCGFGTGASEWAYRWNKVLVRIISDTYISPIVCLDIRPKEVVIVLPANLVVSSTRAYQ